MGSYFLNLRLCRHYPRIPRAVWKANCKDSKVKRLNRIMRLKLILQKRIIRDVEFVNAEMWSINQSIQTSEWSCSGLFLCRSYLFGFIWNGNLHLAVAITDDARRSPPFWFSVDFYQRSTAHLLVFEYLTKFPVFFGLDRLTCHGCLECGEARDRARRTAPLSRELVMARAEAEMTDKDHRKKAITLPAPRKWTATALIQRRWNARQRLPVNWNRPVRIDCLGWLSMVDWLIQLLYASYREARSIVDWLIDWLIVRLIDWLIENCVLRQFQVSVFCKSENAKEALELTKAHEVTLQLEHQKGIKVNV